MDKKALTKSLEYFDSAICRIDSLLKEYPIVTRMENARLGRLELELGYRLLKGELNSDEYIENNKNASVGNDCERGREVDNADGSNNGKSVSVSGQNEADSKS